MGPSLRLGHDLKLTGSQPGAAYVFPMTVELKSDGQSIRRVLSIDGKATDCKPSCCERTLDLGDSFRQSRISSDVELIADTRGRAWRWSVSDLNMFD